MSKRALLTGLVLTMLVFLPITTGFAADTVKIGILAPLSFQVGEGQANAAKMAVKALNAEGGINGKTVELFIEDTEIKPEKAINGYKKLVMVNKVDAVAGVFSSGVVLALMDHVARYKVPLIATASSSDTIGQKIEEKYNKYKYVFRLMLNETDQVGGLTSYVTDFLSPKFGVKKIAIMAEDAKWTERMGANFKTMVEKAGIEVAEYFRFPIKETDFAPILSRIKEAGVDYLIDISAIADGAVYINQWSDLQGPPIGGCNTSAGSEDFWDKTNGKCKSETVFMYGAYDVPLTPTTKWFWNAYQKTYGIEAKYASGFTYDAVNILAKAIEQAKSTKPDKLVGALEAIKYKGVSGLIEFKKKNHNTICMQDGRPTMIWHQWQGKGQRVPVFPEAYAEADFILPAWLQ